MTLSVTTSDLSRSSELQRANGLLKTRLSILTEEVSTGLRKDVAASQYGQMSRVADLEFRLVALDAYAQNGAQATTELEAVQAALAHVQSVSENLGPDLLVYGNSGNLTISSQRARAAVDALDSVVGALNVKVGAKYLLSGAATDTPPVSSADSILSGAKAAALAKPTSAEAITAIDAWFDAPPGGGGFVDAAYHGAYTQNMRFKLSADRTLTMPADAADLRLRDVLKGLALASLVADPPAGQTDADKAELLRAAGNRLVRGNDALTALRASVGVAQEVVDVTGNRTASEKTALSIARSGLLSADPFETATALREVEGRMESLYALTARLSRLSLTDYL